MKCANCGKQADSVCAACWRCKDCKLDCQHHMERTINGQIGKHKDKH